MTHPVAMTINLSGMSVFVEHYVDAPLDRVWMLLSDLLRMAAYSPEVVALTWQAADATRFSAINVRGGRKWTVIGHVLQRQAPDLLRWTVADPGNPSSIWEYALTAEGHGSRIRHSFQHGPGNSLVRQMVETDPAAAEDVVGWRSQMLAQDMQATLEAALASLPRQD